jgi:hypothetical protein
MVVAVVTVAGDVVETIVVEVEAVGASLVVVDEAEVLDVSAETEVVTDGWGRDAVVDVSRRPGAVVSAGGWAHDARSARATARAAPRIRDTSTSLWCVLGVSPGTKSPGRDRGGVYGVQEIG